MNETPISLSKSRFNASIFFSDDNPALEVCRLEIKMADPNTAAIFMAFQKYMDDEMDSKEVLCGSMNFKFLISTWEKMCNVP